MNYRRRYQHRRARNLALFLTASCTILLPIFAIIFLCAALNFITGLIASAVDAVPTPKWIKREVAAMKRLKRLADLEESRERAKEQAESQTDEQHNQSNDDNKNKVLH
ncbi:MAG: hypothetical protein GY833_21910 [Aestuariibacter sp.]|nr:hypothetical protein [Aestuariibacter sp.]|tara:strand:+ start:86606 stop:86929 length:324 start_codon:yes stop_codon:yes gene_type:complete